MNESAPQDKGQRSNEDQKAYWNGAIGERWANEQESLDLGLRAYGEAALLASRAAAGESMVDIGCGAGDTTLLLAGKVGPKGRVLGLDISAPMLDRARTRAAALHNVEFHEGDASEYPLPGGTFDLLFSRFGVMFFADPTAAFSHLRKALRRGGRVAFVCWRTLGENAWAKVPFDAACRVAGPPAPADKYAPGPFAFGEKGRVASLLEGAGFVNIEAKPFDSTHRLGAATPATLEDAVDFSLKLGPAARLVATLDEETKTRARGAISAALAPHLTTDGVFLPSAVWVVTAENPAIRT